MGLSHIINYEDNPSFDVHFYFELLEQINTKYGTIKIGYNNQFGYLLFINNEIQITSYDIKKYHNFISKKVEKDKSIFIVGDGDGGFSHYPWSKNAVLIERSSEMIEVGRHYFGAKWESFKEVIIQDFNNYVFDRQYDSIILAVSDDFNRNGIESNIRKILPNIKKGGKLIAQVGCTFDVEAKAVINEYKKLSSLFKSFCFESIYIPSFFSEEIFFTGVV